MKLRRATLRQVLVISTCAAFGLVILTFTAAVARSSDSGSIPPTDGPALWTPLGPAPIGSGCCPFSGRIWSVAADPISSSVIYVGADGGGVWKTTDGGVNWTPLTDHEPFMTIGALAIDPTNDNIVYAGDTGGGGILKSSDGGVTWILLGASKLAGCPIRRILVDHKSPMSLYVASNGYGCPFGVFKSTDGGLAWQGMALPGDAGAAVTDMVMDPVNSDIVYVAALGVGIYKTVDGGVAWHLVLQPSSGDGYMSLAISASNRQILYAGVSAPNLLADVYKTEDGGDHWHQAGSYPCPNCGFANVIAVDPANSDTVYAGTEFLSVSLDGGSTFAGAGAAVHVDLHALVFDRDARLLIGTDGGLYATTDGGLHTENLNGNLSLTQLSGHIAGTIVPPVLIDGTQDNGTVIWNGSESWREVCGGDGGDAAVDPTNEDVMYCTSTDFAAHAFIAKSDDGFMQDSKLVAYGIPFVSYPVLAMNPSSPNVLYYATNRLYRTKDGGGTWDPISPDLIFITSIGVAPNDNNTIYVAHRSRAYDFGIDVTTDGGLTWHDSSGVGGLADRADIVVDPTNPADAYVADAGVFHTTNSGATWASVSGDLSVAATTMAVDFRTAPNILYVGGVGVGMYRSTHGGVNWQNFQGSSLPNTHISSLLLDTAAGKLVAATYGRGAWVTNISSVTTPTPTLSTLPGDTNCDGRIDGTDVMDVLADAGGIGTPPACIANGDVDGDGHVTSMDGLLILKFWAGLITSFPANAH